MLLLKKIAGELLSPLSIILLLAALGLVLLWFTRRQRLGKLVATAAFLLLVTGAYGWLGGPALNALERQHLPLTAKPPAVKWIVVLGGGTYAESALPAIARMTEATLARVVEGVRLHRQLPAAKLLLSGGPVLRSGSDADSMATLAAQLGIPSDAIVLDSESTDTASQALYVRGVVKGERIIVVTSAAHMPRALALFRKAGVDSVPAPTHYMARSNPELRPSDFFPGGYRLVGADAAAHEYLGIAWAWLTGSL
ncbi:MAG TPA: ElyC/SanA/YdcF family protein [Burkholderiales bacterium]|nr:ElyC/SanA/YdcF family protein [Burkholderiales bacterium]